MEAPHIGMSPEGWGYSGHDGRVRHSEFVFFFFSSRRRHTRCSRDWSSDVCSSDLLDSYLADLVAREVSQLSEIERTAEMRALIRLLAARSGQLLVATAVGSDAGLQIGRASCRERV